MLLAIAMTASFAARRHRDFRSRRIFGAACARSVKSKWLSWALCRH